MKILHLSDTPLSGSPIRISTLLSKHGGIASRHICWNKKIAYRIYPVDVEGRTTPAEELRDLIDWADIIHYHNRWARQQILHHLQIRPPNKPSVIQIHSPRESEDFRPELDSKLPIACVAQYHPRQWPECRFIVPNVVDITDGEYQPRVQSPEAPAWSRLPIVSFAPSNTNGRGWDNKGYGIVNPVLKRMRFSGEVTYDLINQAPFEEVMRRKREADIGIDDIVTGSYHLSALEYLSLGIPCVCHLDDKTQQVVQILTGADKLPFIDATRDTFDRIIRGLVSSPVMTSMYGEASRKWMEMYWNPRLLVEHYLNMYSGL